MKKLNFVLMVALLFCAAVAVEAKTPKECNSGTVSGCAGVKSDDGQCMDPSKCPVEVSTKTSGSNNVVVVSSTVVVTAGSDNVIAVTSGKKYLDHTVGIGTKVVEQKVKYRVKKSSCCSCDCCKNCEKCSCKDCKQDSINKMDKCSCTCDCCKNCKTCSDKKEMK